MAHMLAKLTGESPELIKNILINDAAEHAKEGLFLENIWINDDNNDEVFFIFRTDDLERCKKFIDMVHSQALKENPNVNLPSMIYLKEFWQA